MRQNAQAGIRRLKRVVAPLVLLLVLWGVHAVLPAVLDALGLGLEATSRTVILRLVRTGLWFAGAWLLITLLDVLIWQGAVARRTGRAPPRLLTDLVAALILIGTATFVAAQVFALPVTAIVTTSGIAVAVIGFALRDMLTSLFAGIALNLEHPYAIGDWVEVEPGMVGRVVEVSWLTTRLVTKDGVGVIVANGHLATGHFRNFGHKGQLFRDSFAITLDVEEPPERVERLLLAAVRSVPEVARTGPGPDIKIDGFPERGITWRVRYWLDDYDKLPELRYRVQMAVLRHLHRAGISLPYGKLDIFQASMPQRHLSHRTDLDRLLARIDLFADLGQAELGELASRAKPRRVKTGETVVREGESGSSVFLVIEGVLDVRVSDSRGREHHVNSLGPGSMFGEFSLLTGAPRSATVMARCDGLLMEITQEAMSPILQRVPELAEALSRILAERQAATWSVDRPKQPAETPELASQNHLLQRIKALFHL